jgi:hypothetical protein
MGISMMGAGLAPALRLAVTLTDPDIVPSLGSL